MKRQSLYFKKNKNNGGGGVNFLAKGPSIIINYVPYASRAGGGGGSILMACDAYKCVQGRRGV